MYLQIQGTIWIFYCCVQRIPCAPTPCPHFVIFVSTYLDLFEADALSVLIKGSMQLSQEKKGLNTTLSAASSKAGDLAGSSRTAVQLGARAWQLSRGVVKRGRCQSPVTGSNDAWSASRRREDQPDVRSAASVVPRARYPAVSSLSSFPYLITR
jgi:hypothetical protein